MKRSSRMDGGADDDFTRLIQSERELEERLLRAREEAGRIVAAAREEALGQEAALERELAALAATMAAQVDRERRRRADQILAQAQAEVAGFESVPAERIQELASFVLERLTERRP